MSSGPDRYDYIDLIPDETGVRFRVKVTPRAARKEFSGGRGGIAKIKLNEPPLEGKANKGMIKFLSSSFRVPKSAVDILSGERGRNKLIRLEGITASRAADIFAGLLPATSVKLKR